ncbi:nitrate excretion transporter1 [Perilla frutescens var. hirtella]|uniref:Nitrate excretion transporter1 n=1 Tax=Perilla frutescens var. hirtella TaxID=608512 RepID=A0AAD4JMK3_PERFH|nr:nitrate excretion transporter1 [Perilla frutescens var. hirtella]
MAALHDHANIASLAGDGEPPPPSTADRHRGGWTTFPFVIACVAGLTLAAGGLVNNLIVFLINEFNIESVDAAQINNVFNGCVNLFPLIGAVAADSLLGCFSVIWISSLISLLGFILLLLTVTVDNLSPPGCKTGSNFCIPPSRTQYAVLYTALALVSIGVAGTRFTLVTMGANQFTKLKHQSTYFNWYFFSLYGASFVSATGIVYVEDNVSWGWGFGICIAANVIGLALFLIGSPFYCHDKPQASPFTSLLRVLIVSVRKRKAIISSEAKDYYYGDHQSKGIVAEAPTKSFRSLNRAALKAEGDVETNGSIAKPWRLCSVQQVEDLKNLIRITPVWSSSIFLSTPIGVLLSLTVLQALATDRHVAGRRSFQLSAGSMIVFALLATALGVILTDRFLWPVWRKLRGKNPTALQQIGIGHVLNIASMAVAALVESKRRGSATSRHLMSILWLVPQMVVVGVGEAFHFPGQVTLYYQEFPSCLKSLSSAMVAMAIGLAYYLSTAVVDFIRRITDWLPNDINDGRVDNVYWVMVVIGVINFGYYLVISWLYRCKNVQV